MEGTGRRESGTGRSGVRRRDRTAEQEEGRDRRPIDDDHPPRPKRDRAFSEEEGGPCGRESEDRWTADLGLVRGTWAGHDGKPGIVGQTHCPSAPKTA